MFELYQEIVEVAHIAENNYNMQIPYSSNWMVCNAEEWVRKVVKNVKDKLVAELRKYLPVVDPGLNPGFLEEVNAHHEKFDDAPEKSYMLVTSAMPPRIMVKWLQRWNFSTAIRNAHCFPKTSFNDSKFPNG